MRRRSSLERYFTLKASGFGFLSVKGWFWPPGVLIYREDRIEPMPQQQKSDQPEPIAFFSMLEHPEGASELIFSLPFMLSKHLSAALVVYPRISQVFQKFASSLRVNLFLLSETCLRVFKDSSKQ